MIHVFTTGNFPVRAEDIAESLYRLPFKGEGQINPVIAVRVV